MSRGRFDRNALVGEIFYECKKLIEYCGEYEHSSGGSKPLYKWRCLRCDRISGPSQLDSIKRYKRTHCCGSSTKYGEARWGYKHVTSAYMRGLHGSALKRNLDFEIDSIYLYNIWNEQDGKCAYTGETLLIGSGQASVDRIDPKLGYVKGNVQWVKTIVNRMKWDQTEEDFLNHCKQICLERKIL